MSDDRLIPGSMGDRVFRALAAEISDGADLDRHHIVISEGGWTCDVCGVEVNGQTNSEGHPVMQGDSVRHTP